jgi:hypothetical protein
MAGVLPAILVSLYFSLISSQSISTAHKKTTNEYIINLYLRRLKKSLPNNEKVFTASFSSMRDF